MQKSAFEMAQTGDKTPLISNDDDATAIKSSKPFNPLSEFFDIAKLSVPIFISMVAWVSMMTMDTSFLGHTGTTYLNAFALQSLWTSSTGVFLSASVLGVFCSNSFGAAQNASTKEEKEEKLKLVGVWGQVALFVLMIVTVFIAMAWGATGPVLKLAHSDENLIWPAWYYALVLGTCLPARAIATVMNQFFQSQKLMYPSMCASITAVFFNLVLGSVLVLGFPFKQLKIGFMACPAVTAGMEYLQIAILIVVFVGIMKLHKPCWPGFSFSNVFSRTQPNEDGKSQLRIVEFIKLWLPAALASASDFWRVAVIGVVRFYVNVVVVVVVSVRARACAC